MCLYLIFIASLYISPIVYDINCLPKVNSQMETINKEIFFMIRWHTPYYYFILAEIIHISHQITIVYYINNFKVLS